MLSARENFLETVRHGNPDAFVNEWEPFGSVFDPLMGITLVAQPGKYIVDDWGTTIYWGENEPGAMPIVNDSNKAIPDVTEWKDHIKSPDIRQPLDWTAAKAQAEEIHKNGKLTMSLMATGLFEQSHYLMGFEDTLMNLLMEPEAMHELLDYITDYKLTYAKILVENLHPDVVLFHDDWGSKTSLFMSPDTWREFFKPRYQKIYDYFKSQGVIIIHHSDSYCQPIVKDMVDIGIDVWQGVLPQNDIPAIQKETEGKLVLMGGLDAQVIDVKDFDEEVIRKEVARACKEYAPGGNYIPCLTYGGEGSIFEGVNDIIMDEIRRQSPQYF
ncbi:MAG TPA: uroporphyrinogen decarboxylase (URO-D) [Candidatus Blautia gallistercoris]|uniref:Uroporphyrinogen decarboxylase (URO-D) n=1 Tax=Candidatus Blautia gallistercoris TaxID=2838490 RepID=A0A9D2B314_9FIRM|nr:uroporphyrinogen decarboxylase (URO-D) [Candidatus Blautia gallistercoris]